MKSRSGTYGRVVLDPERAATAAAASGSKSPSVPAPPPTNPGSGPLSNDGDGNDVLTSTGSNAPFRRTSSSDSLKVGELESRDRSSGVMGEFPGISPVERIEIELLLEGIFRHYGYDFRSYAPSSLRRRLKKRLEAENLETFSELQNKVLHDPSAMEGLLRDMSVNVTGMFRDPTFFHALRQKVVPMLRTYPFVRIWHAGCASGEEVYAMAILLEEEGLYERTRLYATDMNAEALDRARAGIYPIARMREYTANYQQAGGTRSFSEYYTASYGAALFHSRLKDNILFAQHNLATDTSFSEFNLILCRNVLIYFDRSLKERTLRLFGDSLGALGFLCLGRRESLRFTNVETEFHEIDPKERIFRRMR